ncbi:hypothetical protein LIA77_08490 [Sarocladium implicatum]|nr:hypothetical protein LIA77_08490 [Sarocladium implicatum]
MTSEPSTSQKHRTATLAGEDQGLEDITHLSLALSKFELLSMSQREVRLSERRQPQRSMEQCNGNIPSELFGLASRHIGILLLLSVPAATPPRLCFSGCETSLANCRIPSTNGLRRRGHCAFAWKKQKVHMNTPAL